MANINDLIHNAENEIGYKEKSWEAYNENPEIIYDKEAGAGWDNVTKYAKEMDEREVYNGPKQGYAWCKVFVDWLFVETFGLEKAGDLLHGWTAGVEQFYNWFRANGQISNSPKIGDLVIFGDCDHIGLVFDVADGKIYTIEGNTSETGYNANGGQVANKEYYLGSSWIKCYARPSYDDEPGPTPPEPPTPTGDPQIREIQEWCNSYGLGINVDGYYGPQTHDAITMVYQIELNEQFGYNLDVDGIFGEDTYDHTPIVRYGAEGNITKSIQSMLYCRGYNTNGVDGLYYGATERAVRNFQANHGLSADGIYGPETGYSLFN